MTTPMLMTLPTAKGAIVVVNLQHVAVIRPSPVLNSTDFVLTANHASLANAPGNGRVVPISGAMVVTAAMPFDDVMARIWPSGPEPGGFDDTTPGLGGGPNGVAGRITTDGPIASP